MKRGVLVAATALVAGWTLTGCGGAGDAADTTYSAEVAVSTAESSDLTIPEHLSEVEVYDFMPSRLLSALPDEMQAAVHWGSVLSFVPTVSRQQQEDILNSLSFAQAAARASTGRDFPSTLDDAAEQYETYIGVLKGLGWTADQSGFQRYSTEESEFRMDSVAVATIAKIATAGQLDVLTQAIETLASLPSEAETVALFERFAAEGFRGNFEVGSAEVDSNGFLSFCLGAFYFEASDERRRFLVFRWGSREVDFWITAQCMTLNEAVYSQARDIVVDRLETLGAVSAATRPLLPAPSQSPDL